MGAEPQSERRGHCHLQVCVARHEHVLRLFAAALQGLEELVHKHHHLFQFMTDEELQVDKHLVVARATGMDFLTHIAQAAREQQLHLRVDVLDALLDDELATLALVVDVAQCVEQLLQLLLLEQSDGFQHGDMRHGT